MIICRGGIWRQHPQSRQDAALIELACAKVKDDEDEENHYSIMIRKLLVRTLIFHQKSELTCLLKICRSCLYFEIIIDLINSKNSTLNLSLEKQIKIIYHVFSKYVGAVYILGLSLNLS